MSFVFMGFLFFAQTENKGLAKLAQLVFDSLFGGYGIGQHSPNPEVSESGTEVLAFGYDASAYSSSLLFGGSGRFHR